MTAPLIILLLAKDTKWIDETPHIIPPGRGFSSPEGSGAPFPPVKVPHSTFFINANTCSRRFCS